MGVDPGEVAGVWAKAGGGKTTLLEVAGGVRPPDEGSVVVAGHALATMNERQRRAVLGDCVGYATRAGPETADLDVASWVELRLLARLGRRAAACRTREVLERVGVSEAAEEPWRNLSNRERILASIARALATEPKLLLVDDPAAGLAAMECLEILDLLRSFADGTGTAVLVTGSDMADLQGVESVWSLSDGCLVGPPREHASVVDLAERASRR